MVFQAVGKLLGYRKQGKSLKDRTRERRGAADEERLCLDPQFTSARITDADILMLVALPKGVNADEWLASNVLGFYNHVSLLYGCISEFCTSSSCPTMKAWSSQFQWMDERGRKKRCSAPQYADYAVSLSQKLLSSEELFPTREQKDFSRHFRPAMQRILRLLFHLLVHIYSSHFRAVLALELHPHLNTLYLHLLLFCAEFRLLECGEMAASEELTTALLKAGRQCSSAS
ncbi:MOB kinase activator 2-like isoform X2 [Rhinatrema bivittatum]|nr:MOB kinase activator 2-like isoform X2 [Rhinatrema bivittatum]XP_029441328.1 MOB kinase activator 2-like isoform X2 [Rhinatrema bivittatum]XP_029442499.1 MOB kinase activator 2-like isoform X2 [Rhinatrema bivittatum]XP_029442500.1 MOB kinase activator 2-like isoform X2 [Rhinatrema bivittatum]